MTLPSMRICYLTEQLQELFNHIFSDLPQRVRELILKHMHDHPPGEWTADIRGVLCNWHRDESGLTTLLAIEPYSTH